MIAKGIIKPQVQEEDLDELLNDDFVSKYTEKRKMQLSTLSFGSLQEITQPEYEKQVTIASKNAWVIVFLYQNSSSLCGILDSILQKLAENISSVKFVKIQATRCIPSILLLTNFIDYPDKNVPTLIIYHQETIVTQLVGPVACGGKNMSLDRVVSILKSFGVPLDLDGNKSESDESED